MENITAKIKLILGSSLKPEEITKLKADILKLETNLTPVAPAAPAAPAATPTVTLAEIKTKDGKVMTYEGELKEGTMVSVMDEATGLPVPAVTGDYELEDGTLVVITDGVITSIKKVEVPVTPPAPSVEEMTTQLSAHKKEIEKDYETKLASQSKNFDTKIDELSKIILSQAQILDKFINTPIETVNMASNKPAAELSLEEYNKLDNYEKVKYNRRNK